MHKNPIWLGFLTLILVATAAYTGKIGMQWADYLALSAHTEAGATAWAIKKEAEDEFIPEAKYAYQVKEAFYNGSTLFYAERTNNPWAAESAIKELAAKVHLVWYSPKEPGISTLLKHFPLKESIYVGILWALCVYFFWLGIYVGRVQH